jgi:subtilase family serine protease
MPHFDDRMGTPSIGPVDVEAGIATIGGAAGKRYNLPMTRSSRSGRPSPCRWTEPLESLEDRALPSVTPAPALARHLPIHQVREVGHPAPTAHGGLAVRYAHTDHLRLPGVAILHRGDAGGDTGSPPSGALTPAQIRHIYAIDRIPELGAGQTIAIVDAYDDPNIFGDADVFDRQFMTTLAGATSYYAAYGASDSWLTQAYASGSRPQGNVNWGQEIALDVEWMHAIAPEAKILLVEAASNSDQDLLAADDYAVSRGATVISDSWGGGEFPRERAKDGHFTAPGVTFVFSAGDGGNQSYPALSPHVLAVGGTTLSYDASYNWSGETGWSGGGGGFSAYEVDSANPTVAYDADPNTGFAVYDSLGASRRLPAWGEYGGTSVGSPQWSALIALANQGRVAAGKSALDGVSQILPAIYAASSGTGADAFYDVNSGRNRVGSAALGYDLVTGRGSPRRADLIDDALVAAP